MAPDPCTFSVGDEQGSCSSLVLLPSTLLGAMAGSEVEVLGGHGILDIV